MTIVQYIVLSTISKKGTNMKKNSIAIGISILAIIFIIIGTMLLITPKINKPKNNKKYNSLFEIADEMYKDSSYLNLQKNDQGIYYMTIGEYKRKGYDLAFIDTTCPDDFEIMYFDDKNKDKYYPVYVVESCQEDNSTKKTLFEIANEMYEDGSYRNLPKNDQGIYYMTIGEYKEKGYDLDLIDSTCQDNLGIIYFDVENKDKYEYYPIYIMESCQKTEEE